MFMWLNFGTVRRTALQECSNNKWRAGQSLQLHAHVVAEAHKILRISRTGVEQSSGGKLEAARRIGLQELDSHRQRTSRPQDCGDSFCGGKLSSIEDSGARISGRGTS